MLVTDFIKNSVQYMSNGNIDGEYFRELEFIAYELNYKFRGFEVNNSACLKFMFTTKNNKSVSIK